MGETIRQAELRNNNAEIMRRVAEGESFTVTVHGRAVADLVPHQREGAARQRLVPAAVVDQLLADDVPGPDLDTWERDMTEAAELFDDGDRLPVDPWEPSGRRSVRDHRLEGRTTMPSSSLVTSRPPCSSTRAHSLTARAGSSKSCGPTNQVDGIPRFADSTVHGGAG